MGGLTGAADASKRIGELQVKTGRGRAD